MLKTQLTKSPSAPFSLSRRKLGSDVVETPGPYEVEAAVKVVSSLKREPAYSFPAAKRF